MASITESWILEILLILTVVLTVIYWYLTSTYNYWKNKNVPYVKPKIGLGMYFDQFVKHKPHAVIMAEIYNMFEGERFCGFYQFKKPTLMIRDPKLVEQIMIKDFAYFEDRGAFPLDEKDEPLSVNLATLGGNKWRFLRHKIIPTFSSGKLKGMFEQISKHSDNFLKEVGIYVISGEAIEAKTLSYEYNIDVMASCAFGLQMKSDGEEKKKFRRMVDRAIGSSSYLPLRIALKVHYPGLAKLLGVKSVPDDVNDYFMALVKATMDYRLKSKLKRPDYLQMLLSLKEQEETGKQVEFDYEDVEDQDDSYIKKFQHQLDRKLIHPENELKFTDEVLAAQIYTFLAAGGETISTTISVVLYFLANYPEVQTQLQADVDKVLARHGGQWTYPVIKDMFYLDQVIQESQRMFTIGHVHMRTCTTHYKIPDSDLVIEKGVVVVIPVQSLQIDPMYYHKPEVFDPSRFAGNNFRPSSIYSPFGDGPRMCIGMRFAILEMKVFLAKLMSQYSVRPSSKTITPLRYDPMAFSNQVLGGVWVTFHAREN